MNWMNSIFYILFLTSISGTVAFILWLVWEKYLEQKKCLKCVFPLLVLVLIFFTIPFMYVVIILEIYDFEQEIMSGTLFLRTPFIYKVQYCVAGIWVIGAIINLRNYIREYGRFSNILKKNIYIQEPYFLEIRNRVQNSLGISKEIEIAINYGVKVPLVCGWFKKKIILPVRDYAEEELEVIFYHEMTHIKQHILEMKKIGIILKFVYWFNPLMNSFLNKLDEWGETECDLHIFSNSCIPFTRKQYFDVALAGLEESDIWLPRMVTQLHKERTLKKRVDRMKKYKKEKDLRLVSSIMAGCLFLAVSGTSVYAMGAGVCNLYEKVYEETVIEEEAELVLTEFIEEPYMEDGMNTIVAEGMILYGNGMSIEWSIPAKTLMVASSAVSLEKDDTVIISVFTNPENKSVKVGLITPEQTKLYVSGKGSAGGTLKIEKAGNYKVFVENTDSVAFTATGTILYQ